jgi:transposase-like protein
MPPIPEAVNATVRRDVSLRTACWACGSAVEKQVPVRHGTYRHFRWHCQDCDVTWSGPGEPV